MKGLKFIQMSEIVPQSLIQDLNTGGNNFFNQGRYQEAIAEYNQALGMVFYSLC